MMNRDLTGPGACWAKTEEDGVYDTILFVTGEAPFLRIKTAISFPDGDEFSGGFLRSLHIGPIIERLCIDESAEAEGGAA